MKVFLVVDPTPCFDCSTEEVIAICKEKKAAEAIATLLQNRSIEVRETELDSIVSNLYHPELNGLR